MFTKIENILIEDTALSKVFVVHEKVEKCHVATQCLCNVDTVL